MLQIYTLDHSVDMHLKMVRANSNSAYYSSCGEELRIRCTNVDSFPSRRAGPWIVNPRLGCELITEIQSKDSRHQRCKSHNVAGFDCLSSAMVVASNYTDPGSETVQTMACRAHYLFTRGPRQEARLSRRGQLQILAANYVYVGYQYTQSRPWTLRNLLRVWS